MRDMKLANYLALAILAPYLLDEIQKGVHKRALAAAHEHLKIMSASLGEEAGAIGAAAYAMDSVTKH